jgi:hypothetical protein
MRKLAFFASCLGFDSFGRKVGGDRHDFSVDISCKIYNKWKLKFTLVRYMLHILLGSLCFVFCINVKLIFERQVRF